MATIFDKETLLDLTVNIIPLCILLFFGIGYLLFNPFVGMEPLAPLGQLLQIGLLAFPFTALAVVTYLSGKAVKTDQMRTSTSSQEPTSAEDGSAKEGTDPGQEPASEHDESDADENKSTSR